ncbi:MAG: hypothetical protein ACSHX6_15210 [Akkermansiaceae bacterium]
MSAKFSSLLMCGLCVCPVVSAYDLHEWGTFTTVSGSDGGLLAGLHVEEEHLPPFVYSHIGMRPQDNEMNPFYFTGQGARNSRRQFFVMQDGEKVIQPMRGTKGIPRAMLANVTVKMETPVIYFYGDDTRKVNVKVGFNGGTISQWYPDRVAGDTPNLIKKGEFKISASLSSVKDREMVLYKPIDFSKHYDGSIEWDVEILPKSEADDALTFKPYENSAWIYPRVADANMLKVGDEFEDFLFYRGVGNFELPATFSVDSAETLQVKNNSEEAIPFAFAFENVGGKFRYKAIGAVAGGGLAKVAESEWEAAAEGESQQVEVFRQMREGLVAQGLTIDEANGMIKTWWKSYFNKSGLRVFWVVPQGDLERILPLSVDPKPASQVRVLVGRADVMRPKFEKRLIADLGTYRFKSYNEDRFIQPYMNRLRQLVKKPVYLSLDEHSLVYVDLKMSAKKGDSVEEENLRLYPGKAVTFKNLKLSGEWKVEGEDQLRIDETVFTLDPATGILAAEAEGYFDSYEIQLPKVLN